MNVVILCKCLYVREGMTLQKAVLSSLLTSDRQIKVLIPVYSVRRLVKRQFAFWQKNGTLLINVKSTLKRIQIIISSEEIGLKVQF